MGTARERLSPICPGALYGMCSTGVFRGFESSSPRFSYLGWVMVGLAVMTITWWGYFCP
ncbi:MAG: hypothetical protein IPL73_19895 [Candidatus Obscuribacter sp.]|nr:hypothetical protein [Candidatus Obscuribacter sp.]